MICDWILKYKNINILACVVISLIAVFYAANARLDASSESLMLDNSESLKYYDEIKTLYGTDNFLILTFTPVADLFASEALENLSRLSKNIENLKDVKEVNSILNVPMVFKDQLDNFVQNKTISLQDNLIDAEEAKSLLTSNSLYRDLLINKTADTASIIIDFSQSDRDAEARAISSIRQIIDEGDYKAQIYMGGVPMIVSDSLSFIQSDITNFGLLVLALIIVILYFFFRSFRWIILALSTCLITIISTVGVLGFVDWPITVVSSNFVALLLIITLSISVHYIIKYQEILRTHPKQENEDTCRIAASKVFKPCFYTSLTTMVAFSSLVISDIKPVMDFGWMMTIGIAFSFLYNFFFLVPVSTYFRFKAQKPNQLLGKITKFFADITLRIPRKIILLFLLISVISIFGITKLSVENRFIDYFNTNTEIYRGMVFLDKNLGGTMPFDVIITAPKEENQDDEFEDLGYIEYDSSGYWSSIYTHDVIDKIHEIIESQPEVGKVLSYSTTLDILEQIDSSPEVDSFRLAVIRKKVPEDINAILFKPYISDDSNQLRFSGRIYETNKDLKRQELLDNIANEIVEKTEITKDQIKISGMLVLYNEMLNSLFDSQIKTLAYVFAIIFVMFIFAFRNLQIAVVAIAVNIFACILVLGIMGLFAIPLDIMTVGIASICVGITIDDTIHYIHRYTENIASGKGYEESVKASHNTVGRAMLLTTIVITVGFAVLAFSNFVPTVYFGLLTGFAMLAGLIADMTLLPVLLRIVSIKNNVSHADK